MGMHALEQDDLSTAYIILDIACGIGDWLFALAQASLHVQCIGMDLHEDAIDDALERAHKEGMGASFPHARS
jgi:ubiquinone/menaquinone biosynthesis C-methylase UbiE